MHVLPEGHQFCSSCIKQVKYVANICYGENSTLVVVLIVTAFDDGVEMVKPGVREEKGGSAPLSELAR
jgi:hypothetical protein